MNKLTLLLLLCLSSGLLTAQSNCGIIYVSNSGTTGAGTGTQTSPTTIINAIDSAVAGDIIRCATGTYNIANAINLKDSITLEGGYNVTTWEKTSLTGATTIYRTTANPEGILYQQRIVAIYGNGISGFRLQDITVRTANPTYPGTSTYGIHLANCSNYILARCQIIAGRAAYGQNGGNGATGGRGSNGLGGANGDDNNDNVRNDGGAGGNGCGGARGGNRATRAPRNLGAPGNQGGVAAAANRGGGGGSGGGGGNEARDGGRGGYGGRYWTGATNTRMGICTGVRNTGVSYGNETGCNSNLARTSTESGRCGANGYTGPNGPIGNVGSAGVHIAGFFRPGGVGTTGAQGRGGQGGSGGGGGAGEGGWSCNDGTGSGGGGGGGGGCGGNGGTGGRGGGSSFGVYGVNSAVGSSFIQCYIIASGAGAGGFGGNGGFGGIGGTGGRGGSPGALRDVGYGGDGGRGGTGGRGGRGGNGRNGFALSTYGTLPSYGAFNLTAQAVITASLMDCTDSLITYQTTGVADWTLSSRTSPSSATATQIVSRYDTTGRFDVRRGGHLYAGFTAILHERPSIPNAGVDIYVCDTSTNLNASTPLSGLGKWQSLGSSSISDTLNRQATVNGLTQGVNRFVWLNQSECCGERTDTVDIHADLVAPSNGILLRSQSVSCGDTATLVSSGIPSGTNAFTWTFNNATPNQVSGNNLNGPYTVIFDSIGNQKVNLDILYHNASCLYKDSLDVNITCVSLPVELIYFEGINQNDSVSLFWSTSSEVNNNFFEVWRKTGGGTFEYISSIKSKARNGNSNQQNNYTFSEKAPANAGLASYKLIQQDFNGTRNESKTINLQLANKHFGSLYPNPFSDKLTIAGTRKISRIEFITVDGRNAMTIVNPSNTISTQSIDVGVYLVRIYRGNKVNLERFVKISQ